MSAHCHDEGFEDCCACGNPEVELERSPEMELERLSARVRELEDAGRALDAVKSLLESTGCSCPCDCNACCAQEHDDGCDFICMACRVGAALERGT